MRAAGLPAPEYLAIFISILWPPSPLMIGRTINNIGNILQLLIPGQVYVHILYNTFSCFCKITY